MLYKGFFADVNDNRYSVSIATNGSSFTGSSFTEIRLMQNAPAVVCYESDDDNIFKSVKYSSASLKLWLNDWSWDIYTADAHGAKVRIVKLAMSQQETNTIVWTGYVTPCLYDMDYNTPTYQLDTECIDGLSTLQYIDYLSDSKLNTSFLDIIKKLLTAAGCYTNFYFQTDLRFINDADQRHILSQMYVSEQNFFDEDGKPMKCDEVLEEVCKYLGVTAIAWGADVYFLNYELIKAGSSTFYRYLINSNSTTGTAVSREDVHEIDIDSYANDKGTISPTEVYTRASVTASLYSYDIAIISPLDVNQMHILAGDNSSSSLDEDVYKTFQYRYYTETCTYILEDSHAAINYVFLQNYDSDFWVLHSWPMGYSNPDVTLYNSKTWRSVYSPGAHLVKVDCQEADSIDAVEDVELEEALIMNSGHLQVSSQELVAYGYFYQDQNARYHCAFGHPSQSVTIIGTLYMWPNSYPKGKLEMAGVDYLTLGEIQAWTKWQSNPHLICQTPDDDSMQFWPQYNDWVSLAPIYIWPRIYVRELLKAIKNHGITDYVSYFGSGVRLNDNAFYESVTTMTDAELATKTVYNFTPMIPSWAWGTIDTNRLFPSRIYVEKNLQQPSSQAVGGSRQYLVISGKVRYVCQQDIDDSYSQLHNNGSSVFPIEFKDAKFGKCSANMCYLNCLLKVADKWWNGNAWTTTQVPFRVPFEYKADYINQDLSITSNKTWAINAEGDGFFIKLPEATVTTDVYFAIYEPHAIGYNQCSSVVIRDLDFSLVQSGGQVGQELDDSDTEYINVIDDSFAVDGFELEFKICTFDNKQPNYSAVYQSTDGSTFKYIDKLKSTVSDENMRSEEHYIYKVVKQYSEPSIALKLNLHNEYMPWSIITDAILEDKTLIVDSQQIDYRANKSTVRLIEKK